MKILFFLISLGGALAAASSRPAVVLSKNNKPAPLSSLASSKKTLLEIRGGGTKENALTAFQVLMGSHGAISQAAPEATSDILYMGKFDIKDDAFALWCMEHVGTSLLAVVLATYLSTSTDLSVHETIVYSSLPCLYTMVKHILKGTYAKLGFMKGFGLLTVASFLPGIPILAGKGDTDLLTKIFVAVPTFMGGLGLLAPDFFVKTFMGVSGGVSSKGAAVLWWWCNCLAMYGALGALLLQGFDVYKALGYVNAGFAVSLIEGNFVRKQNAALITGAIPTAFIVVQALFSYGLLAGDAAAAATPVDSV